MKPVDEDRISTWFSLTPMPIAPKKQLPIPSLCLCLCINTNSFYPDTQQHRFLICSCLPWILTAALEPGKLSLQQMLDTYL